MKNFTYFQPRSVDAAIGLLDGTWGRTEILAGGTSLMDLLKESIAKPDRIVSLSGIPGQELNHITRDDDAKVIGIGARVEIARIAENPVLRELFPGLTAAAAALGSPQIRNMGTLGGNLCQRNTCWYFRDAHVPCLLKGGKKCFATEGENQYHAIFTKGHPCVIVHPSSLAPALIALNATAHVRGNQGERLVPLSQFFQAPSKADQREHVLAPNEVLTRVTIPMAGLSNATYEIRQKQAHDWPLVQAAVSFRRVNGRASQVKIVLGYVAPTPYIVVKAAETLEGKEINEATATDAGKAAVEGATPLSQNGYKVKLAEVAVKRAILIAAGAKRYWEA
jgi:xanthine dehydrogenase YagS FAD-binding subunit